MRIKLFHAANMAEAMRRVRSELGEEALILGNRRVANGVEITAALEPASEAPPAVTALRPVLPPDPEADRLNYLIQRAALLQYGALPWSRPIMLVGTPGAGKTLTAAKLAARLVQQGETPLVITTDSERAGATEQLAAFTRILALDLVVAENPVALARSLAGRPAGLKAIIDMAGCNPFEAAQAETLVTFAVAADASLVWVASAGKDAEYAAELAESFAGLGVRHMIPTKLDLTRRLEGVLRAAEAGGFILTDAGIGAGVIDGIIPLEAARLVSRLRDAAAHSQKRRVA